MLFRWFLALENLDFPYGFPVENQEHITDHTEHENFNAHDDKKYGENGQGNVINSLQPFGQNINSCENTKK